MRRRSDNVELGALLFLVGAAVGAYGTLIGAGGGFLLMPLLLALFPLDRVAALTSLSLSVVALNAGSGSVAYATQRRIDYRLALTLALVTVPASALGALATQFISRRAFEAVFGTTLLVVGAILVHRPAPTLRQRVQAAGVQEPRNERFPLGLALSAAVGWLAGLLGIGGAPPQVVVLTHVMHIPASRAMPTVQFLVLLSALGAIGVHASIGGFVISPTKLIALGTGALLGAQVGAALSRRLSGPTLIRLLAGALLLVGVGLIAKALR